MYRCVSVRFFHFATFLKHAHLRTKALTHTQVMHAGTLASAPTAWKHARRIYLFISFLFSMFPPPPRISNINTGKLATTTHTTIGESHELVFYTEEEVFFRDLCAVQLLGNPASTDAVVVIRRLCAKARLKEQTRLCRRCGVSGTKANSD